VAAVADVSAQAQSLAGNAAVAAAATSGMTQGAGLLGPGPAAGSPLAAGRLLLAGQSAVGNGAVAAAAGLVERPVAAPASEAEVAGAGPGAAQESAGVVRRGPGSDPKFAALKRDVHGKKRVVAGSHPPAKVESGAAQAAARPPADDVEAQGKTANAEKMNAAQPREFDKAAFIKAVEEAIAKKAPKNLEEADEFGDSDKPEQVKKEVQGKVGEGRAASAEEISTTTAAPPDTSAAVQKTVVALVPDRPPPTPGTPDPSGAVPDKLPPSATDMSAGPAQVDRQLANGSVTEQQLAHSNEPRFTGALEQKHAVETQSTRAQGTLRADETKTLNATKAHAQRHGADAMAAMGGKRVATGRQVGSGKAGAKGADEEKRAQVTATLQRVFDATKKDVDGILTGLDRKVDEQFSREEKRARDAFTREHKEGMRRYKDERYGGFWGPARWLKDKLLGLPEEANRIYEHARDGYLASMRVVISDVADTVGAELTRAKRRIAQGRNDLQAEVKRLPADLQAIGRQAAADFAGKFDELTQSVEDKGTELVDTLASKYTDALKSVDDEIAKEKERNKGLVAKVVDAVKGVIDTIIELKNLLLGVLAKAGQAVMAILADPIGFLRNLVSGVGAGLKSFLKNIGQHLREGLVSWLLGTATKAGLQLPRSFDVRGILLLIASLLGLTWASIRARITRKVPEQAVAAAESGIPLVLKAKKEGIGGLWEDIKAQVGDLRQNLISKVSEYLIPTVLVAGITWVLSLLNPASAFIRACKLIIDIVRFIVERGRQVLEFVNAVLDAVIAVARGGGGGVPALVERALARSIPVLIGFLAAVLGIGGIADKVKKIFQELSRPVNKAVDWVVDKIVGLVKGLWNRLKSMLDRKRPSKKPKVDRGKDRPHGKDERSEDDRLQALDAALRDAHSVVKRGATVKEISAALPGIRRRHGLTALRMIAERISGTTLIVHFEAVINPKKDSPPEGAALERQVIEEEYGILLDNQDRFQSFADRRGIIIDVRPTNPASVPHLKQGAIYKPVDIKAKTLNEADLLLGVESWKLGLVGFFLKRPPEPKRRGLSPEDRARAKDRHRMRSEERQLYIQKMMKLARKPLGPGRFVVDGYVVYGYDADKVRHPIAGDHDLFDIQRADGTELTQEAYDDLILQMHRARFGVQHGAVRRWDTLESAEDAKMKEKLLSQHERGGEGLVRFTPHQVPRFVYAQTEI
jgi:hypothetical protein